MTQPGRWPLVAAVTCMVVLLAVSVSLGPGDTGVLDAGRVLLHRALGAPEPGLHDTIVWTLRFPRALLAALVGAGLGAAGTVTQGLFRNPMAAPGVLGISMGAATAAVLGFSFGLDQFGLWVTPTLAALGAVVVLLTLFALAGPATSMVTLLLSGVALGALCSAVTTLMLALDTERWDLGLKIVRWLMGTLEGRSWAHLAWATPPLALGLGLAHTLRLQLDALQLGPDTAASLGIELERTRMLAIATVALLVGAATAVTGVIGFIGLVVPHLARLLVGSGHRILLPTATVLGAFTLLAVDVLARSVTLVVLPPGVITSLMGAPFFLWLLHRHVPKGLP